MLIILIAIVVSVFVTATLMRYRYTARLGAVVTWMATTPEGLAAFLNSMPEDDDEAVERFTTAYHARHSKW